ncbi:hypothetical protein MRY82_09305 [bacterium]|nr:hypothetical protein [bacterium]
MKQNLLILGNKILFDALKKSEPCNESLNIFHLETNSSFSKQALNNYMLKHQINYVYPTSINWRQFVDEAFIKQQKIKVLAVNKQALAIEKDRFFAKTLCNEYKIPFIESYTFDRQSEAVSFIQNNPAAYVIKNRYSSPNSKIKTTVCTSYEQTLAIIKQTDCSDGIFLQKYAGEDEAGHTVFITNGKVYPFCTNQEYKKLYTGNLGETLSTPMGGIVEIDQKDHYGLVEHLIQPLIPWFKKVAYCGPLQVTAIKKNHTWHVLEYNARLGVSSGPMIMLSMNNFFNTFKNIYLGKAFDIEIKPNKKYSSLLHIVSHQYPYKNSPQYYPIEMKIYTDGVYFWDNIIEKNRTYYAQKGHGIVNIISSHDHFNLCIEKLYTCAQDIQSYGSFYRTDIGKTLWPL